MKKFLFILLFLFGVLFLGGCVDNGEVGLYKEGVYYAFDPQSKISVHIVINDSGLIENVFFDQQYNDTTLYTLNNEYLLESGHSWRNEANFLGSYLTMNQGWEDIELDVVDISGLDALTVPDYFIEIDYNNSPEALEYITIPIDGFVLAWNLAIQEASNSNIGVVEGVPTSEEWLEANKPPYEYMDGIYYGSDEAHGYIVRVVIENGYIVDVVFDAITAVNTRIIWNDNGTPGDTSDDFPEVEIISMTTKMALEDHLVLVSGTPWYVEAEMMKEAIIEHQTWDPKWSLVVSGSHEYFNFADPYTIEVVAGVTMAIEGFRLVFEQAINKAIIEE